jgi:DNA-binding beta-propeller fold protein YncE
MNILVTSGAVDGERYSAILAFSRNGEALGTFASGCTITDPRGLHVHPNAEQIYVNNGDDRVLSLDTNGDVVEQTGSITAFDPGGGNFGLDGRYYAGSRAARTILAFPADLQGAGESILPSGIVSFPSGFAFAADGRLYLAAGAGPSGTGANTILEFASDRTLRAERFADDPESSPLDLMIGPTHNILVSSEFPFGNSDAVTTVREYDGTSGGLVRVLAPDKSVGFQNPRGLRLGPDGNLYCVARDEVVAFDLNDGSFIEAVVRLERLNGQAIEFFSSVAASEFVAQHTSA